MLSSIEHEGEEYVVTSIYKMCFEESQVETLVLPTQLERIGDVYESFLHEGLGKLVSLEIDESAPYYKTIDGVLYGCLEKDPHKLSLLYIPCCKKGTLTLESNVTTVDDLYGTHNNGIREIIIDTQYPNFVKFRKGFTFHFPKLEKVTLKKSSDSYSYIGDLLVDHEHTAVFYPTNLTGSYELPKCITSIASHCFAHTKLTEIKLHNNLTSIKWRAFAKSAIETINIPDTVTSMEIGIFSGCGNLKSIHLPANMQEIPDNMFRECKNLQNIDIPESVIKIGSHALDLASLEWTALIMKEDSHSVVTIHNAKENVEIADLSQYDKRTKIEWNYTETKEQQECQWVDELKKATSTGTISKEDKEALYKLGQHMRKTTRDIDFDIDSAIYNVNKSKKRGSFAI